MPWIARTIWTKTFFWQPVWQGVVLDIWRKGLSFKGTHIFPLNNVAVQTQVRDQRRERGPGRDDMNMCEYMNDLIHMAGVQCHLEKCCHDPTFGDMIWCVREISRHIMNSFNDSPTKKYHLLSHRIHGTGIFTYIWLIFMVNVGKYASPMGPMGYICISLPISGLKS